MFPGPPSEETHTDRQTDRQTDRHTDRHTHTNFPDKSNFKKPGMVSVKLTLKCRVNE